MSALFLARARLRRDAQVAALAPLLLPEDHDARALAAHRLVWSLMPPDPNAVRDYLWREERPGVFLVLCRRQPGPSPLFEVDCKPFEPTLAEGDRLAFALRANPTVSRVLPGRRGVRSDVVMHALFPIDHAHRAAVRPSEIRDRGAAWLSRVGERHGFTPDVATLVVDGYQLLRIPRSGQQPIQLGRLEFAGTLTVDDPAVFLAALAHGLGRGRAFGCGLMLIRRA